MSTDPASPCIGICKMESAASPHHKVCRGCRRTLAEIAEWPSASSARKRAILAAIAQR